VTILVQQPINGGALRSSAGRHAEVIKSRIGLDSDSDSSRPLGPPQVRRGDSGAVGGPVMIGLAHFEGDRQYRTVMFPVAAWVEEGGENLAGEAPGITRAAVAMANRVETDGRTTSPFA
jgi:hypothetical protein